MKPFTKLVTVPTKIQVKSPNTQRSAGRLTSWETTTKLQHTQITMPKCIKMCQLDLNLKFPCFFNLSETKLLRWQCCTACTPELTPPHYSNRNHLGIGNYKYIKCSHDCHNCSWPRSCKCSACQWQAQIKLFLVRLQWYGTRISLALFGNPSDPTGSCCFKLNKTLT